MISRHRMPVIHRPTRENGRDNESGPRAALTAGDLADTYEGGVDMHRVPNRATSKFRSPQQREQEWEYDAECGCFQCERSRKAQKAKAKRDTTPTALYRLYDGDGVLLYVGITSRRPDDRFREHSELAWWWPYVTRHVVDWYPNRVAARAREKAWVLTGIPLVNKTELDMRMKQAQEERQAAYREAKASA